MEHRKHAPSNSLLKRESGPVSSPYGRSHCAIWGETYGAPYGVKHIGVMFQVQ